MRLFARLVGLSWLTVAALAAPIATAGTSFSPELWADTIANGTWLVEHFSPYCGHCKAFAPTWKQFVDENTDHFAERHAYFGQVDCAAFGDLCHHNGVKYYPSIYLYKAGEFQEEFKGTRSIPALKRFMDERTDVVVEAPAPESSAELTSAAPASDDEGSTSSPSAEATPAQDGTSAQQQVAEVPAEQTASDEPTPAAVDSTPVQPQLLAQTMPTKRAPPAFAVPDGQVHKIESQDFESIRSKLNKPAFMKYFAPWCAHCVTLAPKWVEMARELEGEVHVFEMDCDSRRNKLFCRNEGASQFPTLMYYGEKEAGQEIAKVEYRFRREKDLMLDFARRASVSGKVEPVNRAQLEAVLKSDPVVFLFLHPREVQVEDTDLIKHLSRRSFGGPRFLSSTSAELYHLFTLPAKPTLLVFKSSSLTPVSRYTLPHYQVPKREREAEAWEWVRSNRVKELEEITASSYPDLFELSGTLVPAPPLVVIALLSPKSGYLTHPSTSEDVRALTKGWFTRRQSREDAGFEERRDGWKIGTGRETRWAWVDVDKWRGWVGDMFDHDPVPGQEGNVVVFDPLALRYWDRYPDGTKLKPSDGDNIYTFIEEQVIKGGMKGYSSRGIMERLGIAIWGILKALFKFSLPLAGLGLLGLFVQQYLARRRGGRGGGYQGIGSNRPTGKLD